MLVGEEIGGAVIGGVILALILWVWSQRVRLHDWWLRQMSAADRSERLTEAEQLETLREQVVDRARELGITLPRSASGNRVTYSDGQATTFIPDHQTYVDAMNSGRVDFLRTRSGQPPTPLSRRDRAWLEQWLADHPLPDTRGNASN